MFDKLNWGFLFLQIRCFLYNGIFKKVIKKLTNRKLDPGIITFKDFNDGTPRIFKFFLSRPFY